MVTFKFLFILTTLSVVYGQFQVPQVNIIAYKPNGLKATIPGEFQSIQFITIHIIYC